MQAPLTLARRRCQHRAMAPIEKPEERWSRAGERLTNAFGLTLLLVLATYVLASLTRYAGWTAVGITALACTAAAVAFGSSGARPAHVRAVVVVGAVAVALAIVAALSDETDFLAAAALVQLALLFAAAATVLRAVLSEAQVDFRTILGAVSVYLIFGLLFTSLYVAIDRIQAGSFFIEQPGSPTGDYVFFSFTTLTTTGYGSLVPAAQPGKMLAGLEMLFGQIFLVTLIAGLVSLWRPRGRG
jgi:hypothetical protein